MRIYTVYYIYFSLLVVAQLDAMEADSSRLRHLREYAHALHHENLEEFPEIPVAELEASETPDLSQHQLQTIVGELVLSNCLLMYYKDMAGIEKNADDKNRMSALRVLNHEIREDNLSLEDLVDHIDLLANIAEELAPPISAIKDTLLQFDQENKDQK